MPKRKNLTNSTASDASDLLASVRILSTMTSIREFRKWLVERKRISDDTRHIRGTKFFFQVALSSLAYSVRYDSSLGLDESKAFARARWEGLDIEEVPNDCEKTILLKRIEMVARGVRRCKTWKELEQFIPVVIELVDPLREILEGEIAPGHSLSKQEATDLATEMHLLSYFHGSQKGYPEVCVLSGISQSRITGWFLAEVFSSYVLCLEYVWSAILGSRFSTSQVNNIEDRVQNLKPTMRKWLKREDAFFRKLVKNGGLQEETQVKTERQPSRKEMDGQLSWMALDHWSKSVYDDEIKPVNEALGSRFWTEPAVTIGKVNKGPLSALFSTHGIPSPIYLGGETWKFKKRLMDYYFLWYGLDVLDSRGGETFNGVPAFLSVVLGASRLRDAQGGDAPITVRVFKHPVTKFRKGFEYSYAVLIEVYGGLTDQSGWLVFYDCAGEDSGSLDFKVQLAKKWLDAMEKSGEVETKEITVDLDRFKRYVQENGRVLIETSNGIGLRDSSEVIDSMRSLISDSRGKFFEYVFFRQLASEKEYCDVRCDFELLGEQIDCMGVNDSGVDVFECKVDVHEDTKEVAKQMYSKQEAAKASFPDSEIRTYLIVYGRVEPHRKSELVRSGVQVFDNFRDRIKNGTLYQSGRKEIMRVLDSELVRIRE